MQDSCITIQVVEEEIICPQPQIQVQEKVVVPVIVQKPKFIPDPSWGNLDECPDNHMVKY